MAKQYLGLEGLTHYDNKLKSWTKALDEPLDEDITTNNDVGGLKAGTDITKDTTLVTIIKKMLVSTKDAKIASYPSCTITNSSSTPSGKSYEVGTTIYTTLNSTYKDGTFTSYTGASTTTIISAGCAGTGPIYTKDEIVYGDESFILKEGSNKITATWEYAASAVTPKKSDATDSTVSIPKNSTSNSLTWTGYYNYYTGAVNSVPETIDRAYVDSSLTCGVFKTSYDVKMNKSCYIICIPKDMKITVKDKSTNANLSDDMKTKTTTIADAGGNAVTYYVYYIVFDSDTGLENNDIHIEFANK